MRYIKWNQIKEEETAFFESQLLEMIAYFKRRNIVFYIVRYPNKNEVFSANQSIEFEKKAELLNGREDLMSPEDQRKFYREIYSTNIAKEMIEAREKICVQRKNGIYSLKVDANKMINVIDGHRLVPNAPTVAVHKVFLIGKCNFFGAYQDDYHTIGFYLQELLNKKYGYKYEVVISSNIGANEFSALYTEKYRKGDIIFCYYPYVIKQFSELANNVITVKDAFIMTPNVQEHLFNGLSHHNHVINKKIAHILYGVFPENTDNSYISNSPRKAKQNYYIPVEADRCYRTLKKSADIIADPPQGCKVGSIVMNCNPFTKGHRYLVEAALKTVDFLYVFIVQEDKSRFPVDDRVRIARKGLDDLKDKVCVLKSGSFIISNETFGQYFDKDVDVKYIEDMEYDLHIFGEVVCKYFNISTRFVGEEPFDKVTAKYNRTMKKILPEYGVEVVEIPRVKNEEGNILCATNVRTILYESLCKLTELLPEELVLDVVHSYYMSSELQSDLGGMLDIDCYREFSKYICISEVDLERNLRRFCDDLNLETYIYGEGLWRNVILEYLMKKGIIVKGFIVDDEYIADTKVSDGFEIIGFSMLDDSKHKVILATARRAAYEQFVLWGGSFIKIPDAFFSEIS